MSRQQRLAATGKVVKVALLSKHVVGGAFICVRVEEEVMDVRWRWGGLDEFSKAAAIIAKDGLTIGTLNPEDRPTTVDRSGVAGSKIQKSYSE